jgi:hypothetical protein
MPKSKALASLDGISQLLWVHGGFGVAAGLFAMGSGCTGLAGGLAWDSVALVVYGPVLIVISVVQIIAGLRIQEYRSWGLGVAGVAGALLMVPACGGVPSLLLMAVGLGVLMNAEVREAFRKIQEGMESREMERIHLPVDDEKYSLGVAFGVVALTLLGWCAVGIPLAIISAQ